MAEYLKLDRSHTNTSFNSWSLGAPAVQSKNVVPLPAVAYELRSDAVDFLHTRSSVLHNYLATSQGRIFAFLQPTSDVLRLVELQDYFDPSACTLRPLGLISLCHDVAVGGDVDPPLEPSVAVATPSPQEHAFHALVSSGHGDVHLLAAQVGGSHAAAISAPVYPLRPAAPLAGKRPLRLEQAYYTADGKIRCVAWSVRGSSGARAACAEVYMLTLSASIPQAGDPVLGVECVQLLRRCVLPPYAVVCDAATERVMLAVEPSPVEEDDVEVVECRAHEASPAAAVQPMDDGDEVDPRTLAEAAARLARFTSQEELPPGPLPQQQWADIYKEAGPDGLGAMGSEPSCELLLLQLQERRSSGGTAGPSSGMQLAQLQALSCGPHRLLAAEAQSLGSALLGLTDDVDCALVQLGLEAHGLAARHVASVPALAYVVAGKVNRKHLLLGTPSSSIAAVLVEGQRYLYVYRSVPPGQDWGHQQVVDMELGHGEHVLGARLLPSGASSVLLILTPAALLCFQLA